jgi:hypothetical protein
MAHPMGMLIQNYNAPMGMRIQNYPYPMGMRVQGYMGASPANAYVPQLGADGWAHNSADFGSSPANAYVPQLGGMGNILTDLWNNVVASASTGATQAENNAIASVVHTVATNPVVQQAVVSSGNQSAINSLAAQLKAGQTAAIANPWTTAALVGGVGISLLLLFKVITK